MIALVPGIPHMWLGLLAIPVTLGARAIAVTVSTRVVPAARPKAEGAWGVLWWGGLRGGISIALVLSLPAGQTRELLLAATFAAVLFSDMFRILRLVHLGGVALVTQGNCLRFGFLDQRRGGLRLNQSGRGQQASARKGMNDKSSAI